MNYIEKVVKSLNLTQLTTLKGLLDTTSPTLRTKVKYINENNKGLNLVYFKEGFFNGRLGILVYTDNYCSFFEYNGCNLNPYELNVETHETKHIESCLMTKNDFRSLVEDCIENQGGSSYTAGDGIKIRDNEISVKVGEGIFYDENDNICLNQGTRNTLASVSGKEIKGKLTIGETEYTVALSTTDEGQAGYITFVIEQ